MAAEAVPARTPERQAFYDRIAPHNLSPLWEKLHHLVTAEPVTDDSDVAPGRKLSITSGVFEVPDTFPKSPPAKARFRLDDLALDRPHTGRGVDQRLIELAAIVADREDVAERVRELTGGELADTVLDVTSGPSTRPVELSLELARPGGTVVLAG